MSIPGSNLRLSAVLLACFLLEGGLAETDGFVTEKGRLPHLTIGHNTMTFATNGAWVLTWQGKDLLSGGITFREKGWLRWGTQMRRTSDADAFEASSNEFPELKFSSTLKDLDRSELFEIEQSVIRQENELRFEYQLKALIDIETEVLGGEFELPLKEIFSQRLLLRFDKRIAPISKTQKGQVVGEFTASEFAVLNASVAVARIKVPAGTVWHLLDDRPFELNVVRAQFGIPVKDKKISKGQEFNLGYTIHLPAGSTRTVALGSYGLDFIEGGDLAIHQLQSGKIAEIGLRARKEGQPRLLETAELLPPASSATGVHFAGSLQARHNDIESQEGTKDAPVVPYRLRAMLSGKTVNLIWRFPSSKLSRDWQLGIFHSSQSALQVVPNPESKEGEPAKDFILHQGQSEAMSLKFDVSTELQPIQSKGESQGFLPLSLTPLGKSEKPEYVEARISLEWKAIPQKSQ